MKVAAVIPSAGVGTRFSSIHQDENDSNLPKQFLPLGDIPLIFITLAPFLKSNTINSIIVPVSSHMIVWMKEEIKQRNIKKPIAVIQGGETRQKSVRNGVENVAESHDIVVVHDAVRPFVEIQWIEETIKLCYAYDGAIVAIKSRDTLKNVKENAIIGTVDRRNIWQAQTPQAFRTNVLLKAIISAEVHGIVGTDEAQLVELSGGTIGIVRGSPLNIKITTREDWELAKAIWMGKLNDEA